MHEFKQELQQEFKTNFQTSFSKSFNMSSSRSFNRSSNRSCKRSSSRSYNRRAVRSSNRSPIGVQAGISPTIELMQKLHQLVSCDCRYSENIERSGQLGNIERAIAIDLTTAHNASKQSNRTSDSRKRLFFWSSSITVSIIVLLSSFNLCLYGIAKGANWRPLSGGAPVMSCIDPAK